MTRGTLTNKTTGAKLVGKIKRGDFPDEGWKNFDFEVEGTTISNIFRAQDWSFEPDLPPVPTEPGVYLPYKGYTDGDTPNVWLLKRNGTWLCLPNCAGAETSILKLSEVRRSAKTMVYLGTGR